MGRAALLFNTIDAGAGDDIIATRGGFGGEIYAGSGNDTLWIDTPGAKVYGGDGADVFFLGRDIGIMDASSEDRISAGLTLNGGYEVVRQGHDAKFVRETKFPWVAMGFNTTGVSSTVRGFG